MKKERQPRRDIAIDSDMREGDLSCQSNALTRMLGLFLPDPHQESDECSEPHKEPTV
jgi:hypothetical protein